MRARSTVALEHRLLGATDMRFSMIVELATLLIAAAPEEEASNWTATLGVSVVWLTGNSDLIGITGTALLEYEGEHWALTAEMDGTYERANAEGGDERKTVAAAIDGFIRPEYHFSPLWGIYVLAGGEIDRVASLDGRIDAEVGFELTPIYIADELLLRFYAGGHFARDFRRQHYPEPLDLEDVDAWGPAVGLKLRYELIEDVQLSEYANVVVDVVDGVRALVESDTVLAIWLTSTLAMTVSFHLHVDTDPPPEITKTDTSLTVGIELGI